MELKMERNKSDKIYVVSEYLDFRKKRGIGKTIEMITSDYKLAVRSYEELKNDFIDDLEEVTIGENKIANCIDNGIVVASIRIDSL